MKAKRPLKLNTLILLTTLATIFQGCSLQPVAWNPPQKPELTGAFAKNELLNKTEYIHLKGYYGPEDIAIDGNGNLFTGVHLKKTDFSDGRILKIDTAGKVTVFTNTNSWVTGLHFDKNDNLIACDQKRGLISVDKEGKITVLAYKDEKGNKLLIPNDVDIASDGIIYFSNTSSKVPFNRVNARKIVLEAKPDGGLYSYNPKTKKIKLLLDDTYFANGVAVSKNDDFVLLVDLAKYRVQRYWLKGKNKGQKDIFIENLPGLPNGISRRKDGTFWLGFTTERDGLLDWVQSKPFLKKIIYALPLWMQPDQKPFGMIMHLSDTGKVLKTYFDTTGKYVSEASSIEEYNGNIYIGGDLTDYIGKLKIKE
jgi:sugar lactone lactonase YvrE